MRLSPIPENGFMAEEPSKEAFERINALYLEALDRLDRQLEEIAQTQRLLEEAPS
jgi:hypothetical protein